MKRILASLPALALCIPAMAATISIVDNHDSTVTITVATEGAEPNIIGLALDVSLTNDTVIGTVRDVTVDTANFNIYPDAAYTQELSGSYAYGTGTPVCAKTSAGQISLPRSSFALSLANLNGEDTPGANGSDSVSITLTLNGDAAGDTLTVCENELRGGIVAVDGTALDADCDNIPGPECVKSDAPFYTTWVDFGMPECWCYRRNCRGDADGHKTGLGVNVKWVNPGDLEIFAAAYNLLEADLKELRVGPYNTPGICADNDRAKTGLGVNKKWVNSADLGKFSPYYNIVVEDVSPCDNNHDGILDDTDNYYFWTDYWAD